MTPINLSTRLDTRAVKASPLLLVSAALVGGGLLSTVALGSATAAFVGLGAILGLAVVAAVVAVRPEWLTSVLLLITLALITVPLQQHLGYRPHVGGWPGIRFALSDIPLLGLAGLAVLWRLTGQVRSGVPAVVIVLYLALLVQYLISALAGPDPVLSLFEVCSTLHALILCLVMAAVFRRRWLPAIITVIAMVVVVHTGFAIMQFATGQPIGAAWFRSEANLMRETLSTGEIRIRPSGLFDHPIIYADYLLISLPILAASLVCSTGWRLRIIPGLGLFIGFIGLVLTLSRGAWISALIALAVLMAIGIKQGWFDYRRLRRLGIATALIVLPILIIAVPIVYERLTASAGGSWQVRLELNRIAMNMIVDKPVTGIGLNTFLSQMPLYDPQNVARYFPATVHNIYLLEASEAGIPALLLFVALFAAIGVIALRRVRRVDDPALRWFVAACLAGMTAFLVSQVADFSHRLEPLRSAFWVYIGLMFGALQEGRAIRARVSDRQ